MAKLNCIILSDCEPIPIFARGPDGARGGQAAWVDKAAHFKIGNRKQDGALSPRLLRNFERACNEFGFVRGAAGPH